MPSGFNTLLISRRAFSKLGIVHSVQVLSAASTLLSSSGILSPSSSTNYTTILVSLNLLAAIFLANFAGSMA